MPKSCIREKCPYLKEPFEECYCRHMSSQAAAKAIRFCGGDFAECDVYKQHFDLEVLPA